MNHYWCYVNIENALPSMLSIIVPVEYYYWYVVYIPLLLQATPLLQDSGLVLLELPDPRLKGNFPEGELQIMAYLAKECLLLDPDARPSMGEVVQILSTIAPEKSKRRNIPVNLFQVMYYSKSSFFIYYVSFFHVTTICDGFFLLFLVNNENHLNARCKFCVQFLEFCVPFGSGISEKKLLIKILCFLIMYQIQLSFIHLVNL